MQIACQEVLLPGRDVMERCHNAKLYGFDAVEICGGALVDDASVKNVRIALQSVGLSASSVCGGIVQRAVDIDPEQRRLARESVRRQLSNAAELRAPGIVFLPIFGVHDHIPDLLPYRSKWVLRRDLCIEMLNVLNEDALQAGAKIYLESLNRYETGFLTTMRQAVDIWQLLWARSNIALLADVFHMNIEEASIAAGIEVGGQLIGHVHLSDNNGQEPGEGSIDFGDVVRALRHVGFRGSMAFECGLGLAEDSASEGTLSGPAELVLPQSVEFLRRLTGE